MKRAILADSEVELSVTGERPVVDVDGSPVLLHEFYLMGNTKADVEDKIRRLSKFGARIVVRSTDIRRASDSGPYTLIAACYTITSGVVRPMYPSQAIQLSGL